MVSIITPAYNSALYLAETIESVIAQKYYDWEMLIVDDCSSDYTRDIITDYHQRDPRIKLLETKQNSGTAKARNIGIDAASGDYIAFLDSDDLWDKDKLAIQLEKMKTEQVLFSFTSYFVMSQSGRPLATVRAPKEVTYADLLKGCNIGCSTVIYNVKELGKQYFLLPSPKAREDYILWLRLSKVLQQGKLVGITQPLTTYRKHIGGISSKKSRAAINQWRVYREIEKLHFLPSVFYFVHYTINGLKKHYF